MPATPFRALVSVVKAHFGVTTQAEVAAILGIQQPQVANWLKKPGQTEKTWARLLNRLVDKAAVQAVHPLVEFSPITPVRSGNAWKFSPDKAISDALKGELDKRIGLYFFYDSAGQAIYVGKATTNLWIEAKQRLGAALARAGYMPKKKSRVAGEVATYVSAYSVNPRSAIHNLEALAIRGFGNNHANTNSANFKHYLNI